MDYKLGKDVETVPATLMGHVLCIVMNLETALVRIVQLVSNVTNVVPIITIFLVLDARK